MTDKVQGSDAEPVRRPSRLRQGLGPLVAAVVMIAIVAALYLNSREQGAPWEGAAGPTTARPADVYETFQTVRNECGLCGTDSPVGGWEAEDGRSLILRENGNFTAFFVDGTTMSGTWLVGDTRLCLSPESGGQQCLRYQQKVDAMMLDEAIYIRQ